MAYSINDKTVFRAGWGKSLPDPTGQGINDGFSKSTNLIASHDDDRTPTYVLSNPFRTGLRPRPGALCGPLTFLGLSPGSRTPTSSCRTSTSSRPASSASCR